MSDNPYQNDRGNHDVSITRPGTAGATPNPGTGQAMQTGTAYLIGDMMTGGLTVAAPASARPSCVALAPSALNSALLQP